MLPTVIDLLVVLFLLTLPALLFWCLKHTFVGMRIVCWWRFPFSCLYLCYDFVTCQYSFLIKRVSVPLTINVPLQEYLAVKSILKLLLHTVLQPNCWQQKRLKFVFNFKEESKHWNCLTAEQHHWEIGNCSLNLRKQRSVVLLSFLQLELTQNFTSITSKCIMAVSRLEVADPCIVPYHALIKSQVGQLSPHWSALWSWRRH